MQKKDEKNQPRASQSRDRKSVWMIGIAVALVILLIIDSTAIGGNIRFYSSWIKCGNKPVATLDSGVFGGRVPSYYVPPSFEPIRFDIPNYFCTPQEAEANGYSSNPDRYEFKYRGKDN